MPFKSKSQMRAFFAKEKRGEMPKGTAKRWLKETPDIGSLPERIKEAMIMLYDPFTKIAKRLFDPQSNPPISAEVAQRDMIANVKDEKMQGMSPVEYRNEITSRTKGIIKRNRQTAKAA